MKTNYGIKMGKLIAIGRFLLATNLLVAVPTGAIGAMDIDDPLVIVSSNADGYLDVTQPPYNLNNTGNVNKAGTNTTDLQAAIDYAQDNNLVVFFPAGTYYLNDQLKLLQSESQMTDVHVLVGSASGVRPLIKLKNNASGFGNANNPKALFFYFCSVDGTINTTAKPAAGYNMVFRGLDVDLGSGNNGAIAIDMEAAQGCTIQDVKIDATGAFAGIDSLCGSGTMHANVEIVNGQYGFYVTANRPMATLVGITCTGQTVRAFQFASTLQGTLTIVGFKIKTPNPNPVFVLNATKDDEHLSLVDGSIEFTGPEGVAIDNDGRSVYLSNVTFKNTSTIVDNSQGVNLSGHSGWKHIEDYSFFHVDDRQLIGDNATGPNLTDGEYIGTVTTGGAAAPEADLLSRHLWNESLFPHFEDGNCVFVDPSGGDDTSAIQSAIDTANGKTVFLRKGDYTISDTLVLLDDTRLVGVSRNLTRIDSEGWSEVNYTPMISTPNNKDATCILAWMTLKMPVSQADNITFVEWRAGRHSMVREVNFRKATNWDGVYPDMKRIQIIGPNGGGRWYSLFARSASEQGEHPDFRNLLVTNTAEPLSFYALCTEYTEPKTYQVEIRNCENVSIYGFKCETDISGNDDKAEGVTAEVEDESYTASGASATRYADHVVLEANSTGDYIEFTLNVPLLEGYDMDVQAVKNSNSGKFQLSIDGNDFGGVIDLYKSGSQQENVVIAIGDDELLAGNHTFRFTVVGTSGGGYELGIDELRLMPMKHTTPLGIVNSQNVIVIGQGGHGQLDENESGRGLIEIVGNGCADIQIANATGGWKDNNGFGIVRDMFAAKVVKKNASGGPGDPCALYSLGDPAPVVYVPLSGGGGSPGNNLLVNCDLETGNISPFSNGVISTEAYNGSYAAKLNNNGNWQKIQQVVDVIGNTDYDVSAYLDVTGISNGNNAQFFIQWLDGGVQIDGNDNVTSPITSDTAWTYFSNTLTSPTNADQARLRIVSNKIPNGRLLADDIWLSEAGAPPPPPPPGDSIAFAVTPPDEVTLGNSYNIEVDWSSDGNYTVEVRLMLNSSPWSAQSDTITLNVGAGQSGTDTFNVTVDSDADTSPGGLRWRMRLLDGLTAVVPNVVQQNVTGFPGGPPNLVVNGDAEAGNASSWSLNRGSAIATSSNVHNGSYSLEVDCDNGYIELEQHVPVTVGKTYDVSGFLELAGRTSGSGKMVIVFCKAGGASNGGWANLTGDVNANQNYLEYTHTTIAAPANSQTLRVRLISNNLNMGAKLRFDDVSIIEN